MILVKHHMNRNTSWLPQRIYSLATLLYFAAVLLRAILDYGETPSLFPILVVLSLGLVLFLTEPNLSNRFSAYFWFYLVLQTLLVFYLLSMPNSPDFFATLLAILSMQAMLHLDAKIGSLWIGFCAAAMFFLLKGNYGVFQAVALALIYSASNVIFGTFTLTIRKAQMARIQNQGLALELSQANQQLETYASQVEQLAINTERNRLARELHDSVTQTVFSMTLVTQSALLAMDREFSNVGAYLDRLNLLARSALSEMQVLVSELKPENSTHEPLGSMLQQHLKSSRFPPEFKTSLVIEGDGSLSPAEENGLFHIAEEALNNIVKHAHTLQAQLHLHLVEPYWMEIKDNGCGFAPTDAQDGSGVGLSSMRERAAEMGWELTVVTLTGQGTCVRAERRHEERTNANGASTDN